MKNWWLCLIIFISPAAVSKIPAATSFTVPADTARNIIVITLDGFRWQELFRGPDQTIIADKEFTSDAETVRLLYDAPTAAERRKKLMPFLWSVAAAKGTIFGNRQYGNKVNVANLYAISYPGYNEMFTGTTDAFIWRNDKKSNTNLNVFEYLAAREEYRGKIAAFTSWNLFPFILNKKRNGLNLNSGYEQLAGMSETEEVLNYMQENVVAEKNNTRQDMLTYIAAKEHLGLHRPKLLFLGLGETDEYAHHGDYAMYLQRANDADRMIAELWHWVQTTPGYKDNTTFIITTDHGRGQTAKEWTQHGTFVKGSSQTWLVMFGSGIATRGEATGSDNIYQKQLAQTIAMLAGCRFGNQEPIDYFTPAREEEVLSQNNLAKFETAK